ncbi:energy transducer TonB [Xanthomonas sacchari]|uniref:energy transducer TonB n=1 Tax=Xanthomonas sacchari TaxID=56458 RepID=UPI002255C322|nr:energy transducer TonB [Xanthomonas sacchari]UYK85780.1 energy transducer TonB [Xanthomonas sacchari]
MNVHPPALRRWLLSLGLVLAAHALVLAVLLAWPSRMPVPPPSASAPALLLDLAPAPVAPPAVPTDLAPGPPQRARRDVVRTQVARATPPPVPTAPVPAQAQAQSPPTPLLAQQDTPQESAAAQASAPPGIVAPPAERYAAPQSLAGTTPQARVTWQAQLLGHLQRYKRYPRAAQRRRQEGVAHVGFAVDQGGHAGDLRLVRSSGHDTLDAEALATVRRAEPLPPPPAEMSGDAVQVVVPVEFFLR